MGISQICLDMDGVLVQWDKAACELLGFDLDDIRSRWKPGDDIVVPMGISKNKLWRAIDEAGEDFWANLEPYPWAEDLWELCNSIAPTTISTSPSQHPSSLSGKLISLTNMFGHPFRDYHMGTNKHMLAIPDALLIDDNEDKCKKFAKKGLGRAIVFPQPWNSLHRFQDNPFEFVAGALRKLEAS